MSSVFQTSFKSLLIHLLRLNSTELRWPSSVWRLLTIIVSIVRLMASWAIPRMFLGNITLVSLLPPSYHYHHLSSFLLSCAPVNPQAVNEPKFDVFTANVRSILYLTHTATGKRVAFAAIGALLVGSIVWTKGAEKGAEVKRGEELGYFAYGGSTVIALFPKGVVEFDQDLVKNSEEPIETLVKVGAWLTAR